MSVYLAYTLLVHTSNKAYSLANMITSLQHTYGWYSLHHSTAAPIAVGGHKTDSV